MGYVLSAVRIRAFWTSLLVVIASVWIAYAATASAASSSDVYTGDAQWDNWSWGAQVRTEKVWPIYDGKESLSVMFERPWAALSLATDPFDTKEYTVLRFMVHGNGRGLPALTAVLHDQTGQELTPVGVTYYAKPAGNGWYEVVIPLEDLGAKDTKITRVSLQDRNGSGNQHFNVAGIQFTKEQYEEQENGEEWTGYSAYVFDDEAHWNNWSWDTQLATVNDPVYKGVASLEARYQAPWAGVSFQTNGFVSGYSHLEFAFNTNGGAIPALKASVYGTDGEIGAVSVTKYIKDIRNGWFMVSIPLADLGAEEKEITRVTIQDNAGKVHQTLNIDELRFYHE